MDDLEVQIRQRYLDSPTWDPEDPNLDFGLAALSHFIAAFSRETDPARRHLLVRTIWEFRDPAALPALGTALADDSADVWKEALDGIVTIGGQNGLRLLREARASLATRPDVAVRLDWIAEAGEQIEQEMKPASDDAG